MLPVLHPSRYTMRLVLTPAGAYAHRQIPLEYHMSKADHAFLRTFSTIILGLVLLTAVIVILARSLTTAVDGDANPSQQTNIEQRLKPVAAVRVGAEGAAAIAAAEQAQAMPAPAESTAAAVDGQQVYGSVCTACHAAGVAGAPMPGSEVMAQRLAEKGLDGLVASAITGINVMPPRGGRPDLSDEQIRAAIEFMLQ